MESVSCKMINDHVYSHTELLGERELIYTDSSKREVMHLWLNTKISIRECNGCLNKKAESGKWGLRKGEEGEEGKKKGRERKSKKWGKKIIIWPKREVRKRPLHQQQSHASISVMSGWDHVFSVIMLHHVLPLVSLKMHLTTSQDKWYVNVRAIKCSPAKATKAIPWDE